MARLLKGKPVADAMMEKNRKDIESLKNNGISPALAVFRIGEKDSDLSYEKAIIKKAQDCGLKVISNFFAQDVTVEEFYRKLDEANNDNSIHGILVFRPLPDRFDDEQLRNRINPMKDVDGCNDHSLAGIFTNNSLTFAPCTAQAVIEILKYYDIDPSGKKVTVIGRSLVIGKPVAMMLCNMDATVTVCHKKTKDLKHIAANADILITTTGKMEIIDKDYINWNQTIIDVGVSWNEDKQKICGDVLFEEVEPLVKDITPVPGGVGSVTSAILISHVITSCIRSV